MADVRELKDQAAKAFSKGKFDKAATIYQELCKLEPRDMQMRVRLGDVLVKKGDKPSAIGAYRIAAETYAKDGFLPRAIAVCKLILDLDPKHVETQDTLAQLYAKKTGRPITPPETLSGPGAMPKLTRLAPPSPPTQPAPSSGLDLDTGRSFEAGVRSAEVAEPAAPAAAESGLELDTGRSFQEGVKAAEGPARAAAAPDSGGLELDVSDRGHREGVKSASHEGPPPPAESSLELESGEGGSWKGAQSWDSAGPEPVAAKEPPPPPPARNEPAIEVVLEVEPEPARPVRAAEPIELELEITPEPAAPKEGRPEVAPPAVPIELELEVAQPLPAAPVEIELEVAPAQPAAAPVEIELEVVPASQTQAQGAAGPIPEADEPIPLVDMVAEGDEPLPLVQVAPVSPVQEAPSAPAVLLAEPSETSEPRPVDPIQLAQPVAPPVQGTPPARDAEADDIMFPEAPPAGSAVAPVALAALDAAEPELLQAGPAAKPSPVAEPTPAGADGSSWFAPPEEAGAARAPASLAELGAILAQGDDASFEELASPTDVPAMAASLPEIPLFSDLSHEAFVELASRCTLRRCEPDEVIVEEGTVGTSFFVLASGLVRVSKKAEGKPVVLARLGEGAFFGEMALLSGTPRTASVIAEEEGAECLEISAELLANLQRRYPQVGQVLRKFARQRLLSNVMSTAKLFQPFDKTERKRLVEKFRAREVRAGEAVLSEGKVSDGLYVVMAGDFEVRKRREGAEQRLATLKSGDVFGEISLLTKSAATATVAAISAGTVLRLPRETFNELISTHPQILMMVSELSDERLRSQEDAGPPEGGYEDLLLV